MQNITIQTLSLIKESAKLQETLLQEFSGLENTIMRTSGASPMEAVN